MAELLIFHHAQGLTPGVRAFGERMAAAGHTVHVPDLFDGRTFDSLDYPGDQHLFADEGLPAFDAGAAAQAARPACWSCSPRSECSSSTATT